MLSRIFLVVEIFAVIPGRWLQLQAPTSRLRRDLPLTHFFVFPHRTDVSEHMTRSSLMLRIFISSPVTQLCSRVRARPLVSNRGSLRMLHHLMVGTWTPPGAIFTFEFDDEKLTLELIKRTPIPENEPISWMTFDVSSIEKKLRPQLTLTCQHARKNIYGSAMKKWSSFAVKSPTEISHRASHPMEHERKISIKSRELR